MTFQHIITHLGKPHSWYIVLTGPHAELSIKKEAGTTRFYYLRSGDFGSALLGRVYKEIHTPVIARCVFIYATDENIQGIQNEYTVLSPQTVTALYQNQ